MAMTHFIPEAGCWLFGGAALSGHRNIPHGVVSGDDGQAKYAHRVSWEFNRGSIPEGMCVLHKCDVARCVNPDHLFLGTIADNNADMHRKKRHQHGERHYNAKLSEDDVRKIWDLRGSMRQNDIAKMFGVSHSRISHIYSGKDWPHMKRTA